MARNKTLRIYTKSKTDELLNAKVTKPTTSLDPSTSVTIQTLIDLGIVTYIAPSNE